MPAHRVQPPKTAPAGQPKLVFSAGSFQGFSTPPPKANASSPVVGGKRSAEGDPASVPGEDAPEGAPATEKKSRSATEEGRKWKESWPHDDEVRDGALWAYFCGVTHTIKCRACEIFGKITALSNADGIGSDRIRVATLREHTINKSHIAALKALKQSRTSLARRVPASPFAHRVRTTPNPRGGSGRHSLCAALVQAEPHPVALCSQGVSKRRSPRPSTPRS